MKEDKQLRESLSDEWVQKTPMFLPKNLTEFIMFQKQAFEAGIQSNLGEYKEVWQNKKPVADREMVFVSAHKFFDGWEYKLWEIKKIDSPDGWYYGLCNQDGEEWGPYEDLAADKYFVLPGVLVPSSLILEDVLKGNEDCVTSQEQSPASVVSHSCTSPNSIEQESTELKLVLYRLIKKMEKDGQFAHLEKELSQADYILKKYSKPTDALR